MDDTERAESAVIREQIAVLEQRLTFLYARRELKILKQAQQGNTHRVIAAAWAISQPRVTNIVNKDRLRRQRDQIR